MKKKGFTLAEVLITLAIIGTVAAITLPALMADTTSAQIGPKLAKAVSMFEQANEAILNEHSVDTLSDANLLTSDSTYVNELRKHLKGTSVHVIDPPKKIDRIEFSSKDGMLYTFSITAATPDNSSDPGHMQRIGNVTIDINGKANPNADGTDIFYFSWWNDGSLRPKGATSWTNITSESGDWRTKCARDAEPKDATYCAGHVFENNLKVLYK